MPSGHCRGRLLLHFCQVQNGSVMRKGRCNGCEIEKKRRGEQGWSLSPMHPHFDDKDPLTSKKRYAKRRQDMVIASLSSSAFPQASLLQKKCRYLAPSEKKKCKKKCKKIKKSDKSRDRTAGVQRMWEGVVEPYLRSPKTPPLQYCDALTTPPRAPTILLRGTG